MTDKKTLCVVGLGLIGGSFAASLKARGLGWRIRAMDRRRSGLDYALKRGIIDEAAESLEAAARGAEVVVLAAQVRGICDLLVELSGLAQPGQVVTDVGSTKGSIVATAQECLPAGVGFVGGHPVAGTERSGIESAQVGLFKGRTCVLTPIADTPADALETVAGLWREVGAEVVLLDPQAHDRIFALISHLPHMVAYSLVNAVASELSPSEAALGSSSLRDFTRVAQSQPGLWRDICVENREALVQAMDDFAARLSQLRDAVAEGDETAIEDLLQRAVDERGRPWML